MSSHISALTPSSIRQLVVVVLSRRTMFVALIPAFVLGIAIARNAIDVPVDDQWELVRLFSALQEGHLSWRDVTAVHNEHRYAIPNLYFLGLGVLTKWDVRWEMWTTFVLACGSISGMTAAVVTFGRVGIDDADLAFVSRYLLFAGPMVVATGVLWTDWLSRVERARHSRSAGALVTTIVVLEVLAAAAGMERMAALREKRLQGKALLAFVDHVAEPGLSTKVYPLGGLRDKVHALERLGYLRPSLVGVPWRPQSGPADNKSGRFEKLTVRGSLLEAEGWAVLRERNEPADAVVLAVETAAGCCTIVAVADQREPAPTLIRLGRRAWEDAGWRTSIAFGRLPTDAVRMRAWAYDAMTGQSIELSGRHKIERPES